jgi:putative transposase
MNIYHWCVMSNHFHLAIEALKVSDLSRYIGKVCELYSRYFHRKHGGCGTIWQGRYKSCVVQKEGFLLRLGRYIERNPVRAELEKLPWDYEWSSCRAYIKEVKDILVEPERHPVWKQLGESDALRRQKYRQIINNEKEATSEEPDFKDLKKGIVGDDEFRKSLRNSLGRLIPRKPGRR